MKTTLRTFGAAFCLLASVAQAQINLGDIAIIQVNNITDGFTWVALKNISSTASATDSSWGATSGQGWRTTESYHTTLPASIGLAPSVSPP